MLHTIAVLVVSTVPALAFLVLILALDRREPEPIALVLEVMALGAVSAVAAALAEFALQGLPLFGRAGIAGAAAVSFLQVAPVEEGVKLAVVLLSAWRKPAFNEENDGIVYTGAAAIGFALLENIIYVVQYGLGAGAARAVSAIPLHVFTGVLAGLHLGLARFAAPGALRARLVLRGLALAWFVHGLYDMLAMSGNALALLLLPLLAGLATFGIIALRRGRLLSLARWGTGPTAVDAGAAAGAAEAPSSAGLEPAPAPRPASGAVSPQHRPRQSHRWMPVVSRTLLCASVIFWVLLVAGLWFTEGSAEPGSAVLGGVALTILPTSIGVGLEIGWQRRKRRASVLPSSLLRVDMKP